MDKQWSSTYAIVFIWNMACRYSSGLRQFTFKRFIVVLVLAGDDTAEEKA
jgi:hypothetical protein